MNEPFCLYVRLKWRQSEQLCSWNEPWYSRHKAAAYVSNEHEDLQITTKRTEQIFPKDWEPANKKMHSIRSFHSYKHSLPLQFRSWLYAECRSSMNLSTIISTLARLVPGCWTRQTFQANKRSTFFRFEIHRSQTTCMHMLSVEKEIEIFEYSAPKRIRDYGLIIFFA
jgi:hypothetical protein